MLDKLHALIDSGAIPFIAAAGTAGNHSGGGRPNVTRIIEAILIALLSAGSTILVLQKDVEFLKDSVTKQETRLDRFMEKQEAMNLNIIEKLYRDGSNKRRSAP